MSSYRLIEVAIAGDTPLMQYKFTDRAKAAMAATSRRTSTEETRTTRQIAEEFVYTDAQGLVVFPGAAITTMMRQAGSNHKIPKSRKSVKGIVPAAVRMTEDSIEIYRVSGAAWARMTLQDFEVDSRPVVVPATKGRVMAHRPIFERWGAKFVLRINTSLISEALVQKLLEEGGEQLGIGAFRPERGGTFGTFRVVSYGTLQEAEDTSSP